MVVFKFPLPLASPADTHRLTVTMVVFKYNSTCSHSPAMLGLTVTMVVFKCTSSVVSTGSGGSFNSNNGCI